MIPAWRLCVYCSARATQNDHVDPRSRGGQLTLPTCAPCNQSKGARSPAEWIVSAATMIELGVGRRTSAGAAS